MKRLMLYAGFLWKNNTVSASGSKVTWKDVCMPKQKGGLSIRLLKRTWNYFSNTSSLWVPFWQDSDSTRFSPSVRSMLPLRPMLNYFMRCVLGDGASASFWFDTWTYLGPLISVLGDNGPRDLRLRIDALRHVLDRQIRDCLLSYPSPNSSPWLLLFYFFLSRPP